MHRSVVLFLFIFILSLSLRAQDTNVSIPAVADTLVRLDSTGNTLDSILVTPPDSVSQRPLQFFSSWEVSKADPFAMQVLYHHPYYNFSTRPAAVRSDLKKFEGKEVLFYLWVALLVLFALFKLAFAKYFSDLFRVFFRTTLKQRQIREQLMQSALPSLAFNIFFVAVTGLYINFLLHHYYTRMPVGNFWLMYLYCCLGISAIYMVKFAGLKTCGWLFNMRRAAEAYIFIVFIINKVIGIFLLPVVILLSIAEGQTYQSILVLSWCGVGGLLLYRFILGYAVIRNEVRFNLFHFFLYLCSFEIAPLLLIYRLLLLVF